MIRVSKVIIGQYPPYLLHRGQLPSEGEAPQYPISDTYRSNREHLYHSMMNESKCEYTMSQEHVQQIHIWWCSMQLTRNISMVIIITMMIRTKLQLSYHHNRRNTIIIDRYHPFRLIMIAYWTCDKYEHNYHHHLQIINIIICLIFIILHHTSLSWSTSNQHHNHHLIIII